MIAPHGFFLNVTSVLLLLHKASSSAPVMEGLSVTPRRCWWCQNPGWRSKSRVAQTSGQRTKTHPWPTDGTSSLWHPGSLCWAPVVPPLPLLGTAVNKTKAVRDCPAAKQPIINTNAASSPPSGFLAQWRCEQWIWEPRPSWWQEWTASVPPPTGAMTGGVSGISPEDKCQLSNQGVVWIDLQSEFAFYLGHYIFLW